MDFLKKASYYLSNNQNLRRGIFISVAVIFLLAVVLFNSDIQNLLKRPGAGKAADGPIESENNWSADWDDINFARSNAKMIDVIQDGQRWLYLIGGTEKIWDDDALNKWYEPEGAYRLSLISEVERIKINDDGSPILDDPDNPGFPAFWESAPAMVFGHAEFGLLEHDGYIYVISGDIHMPVVEEKDDEFPLLYSTIERLSLTDLDPQWEVAALVTGVNFYPEVKIWNNQLHIVGGVYGNPFNGSTYNIFDIYGAKDPLVLADDVAAWDGVKNKPRIGDLPFWLGDGGLGQTITGPNTGDPDPGLDPIDIGLIGGGTVTYNPNLNNQVMIQQITGPARNSIAGLPPWYPEQSDNLNLLLSQLLLNGAFYTTVSEHYIVDLNGDFTWTAGELDSDYISSQPLTEDLWVENRVIKIAHLRLLVSWGWRVEDYIYPTIQPAPQGRYGHKLVVHNNHAGFLHEDLLVIGGASWSNPWVFGFFYGDDTPTFSCSVSVLFWVNDDEVHPFTDTWMWNDPGDKWYSLYGYDYQYVGNVTYRWNTGEQYWEGTNTDMASFPPGNPQIELDHNYMFGDDDIQRGKAFFGLAELNLPDNEDVFIVTGGLENVPSPGDDDPNFYRGGSLGYIKFGIPVQITNEIHKLAEIEDNGWQHINSDDMSSVPNSYGLTSIGLDNYRSISINGQTEFQAGDQFTNVHVPDYNLSSTNDTSMLDSLNWANVNMPSDGLPNKLENLAFSATYDVRTTNNGVTTVYIYRAGGSNNNGELPNPVYTAQYIGPFTYGEDNTPNPGTSEFSVEPPLVLADGLHYATATGVLRDYHGIPVAGQQIAVTIDDDSFPPTDDGDVKVLPVPDNLKVRAQDTPDMTVIVNAGYALFDDHSGGFEKVSIGVTNSAVFEQPILNNRIDLLVLTENGLLDIIKGAEAISPVHPAIPNNTVVLAGIYIRPDQTEILDLDDTIANFITDARSDDLKFGAGNSPGQSGYSEKFIETDANGSFQFRLSSIVAAQHEIWLHVNISLIPDSSWFVKVGPWDVEFTLDGVPDAKLSSLVADPNQVLANGVEYSTVTVALIDNNGMPAPDYWVDIFSNRNKFTTNGYISAFAEGTVAGQTLVTSINHGLPEGSNITISDTTNYNGIYIISDSNINTFEISATWIADDATGLWTVDLVDNISLAPNYTEPVSDINGQVQFRVDSKISGLAVIFGKYSIDEEGLSSNFKYVWDYDTIEFGGHISSLEPGYGRQGQALEYIIATGAQTHWDNTTTEVKFIPPGEINFQETDGGTTDGLRIIANGYDSAALKIKAPDYPNADLDLAILEGSGSFFGIVPTNLNGFGEANFIYTSGNQAGIVKIIAKINGGLLAGGIEEELWFIEDEPLPSNYELEITVVNPHLDDTVNETVVKSAVWLYVGSTKVIVDNQTNSFNFSSDDNGVLIPNPVIVEPGDIGVAVTTYIKDTEDGKAQIFVEVDFKPNPTDTPIHLMASQLILKDSAGSVDGISPDTITVINSEKIDLGGENVADKYVHISENAKVGLWTVSIYTPNVDSGPFSLSMDETVQHPFVVLPASGGDDFEPRIINIQPWYGVFGETQKVVDIIGINTTFTSNYWVESIVAFTATDISQPIDAITVNSIEVVNQTYLRATITISENTAALGWYNVSVTTGDEVALKPGDQDFLVTGISNFALHLYSNLPDNEIPRDGQSQANITAQVVFIDPTDGSVTPRKDIAITFDHSDAGPVKPPSLAPLETSTNEGGFAYSLYTTDAGDVNELIDITATALVYPISGDPVVISNKISILKIVHPYDGFTLSALPNSLPLYGLPNYSILTAEGLPSNSNISVWFSKIMGKGNVIPLQTSTNTGTALSRYYSAPEAERIPETIEIEAFAVVPGIGIIKSNSTLIQIGEDDADYKLNLTAIPNEVQAGGILTSDVTAALTFLNQPSSNWPIHFELIQEQAGDYITETLVWTDYPAGLAKTEFVPGYIAGAIMVRARPLGLNIVKDVVITKIADQNPDEYLTVITAVPRYVPTSNDGSDFSTVTVTVRNEDFTPLENVTVKLTTDRVADTIRLDDGSINDTTSTNENGQAIFRVSSTEIGVSLVEAIVGTFSVSTDIVFEGSALLTSRILDVRVPFQARDYDNLTWIYVSEETASGNPLVFINEVYTKLARPDDRLSVLKNVKMYFHIDQTYNLWAKGRNHLSRVEQFFPGDKTGEGETIVIDMTKIINSKEYGLFVADIKPDERDSDGNGNMVPSPFHDNEINAFDFGLLISNFYKNHYTANINWPIDEIVNNFDALYIFLNYGAGEEGGPPPYK